LNPEIGGYFDASIQALENLKSVRVALAGRGIDVPELLGHAKLSVPIKLKDQEYHACQLMTRVGREPMEEVWWWLTDSEQSPKDWAAAMIQLRELAQVAAKMHVQVGVAGKTIDQSDFDWVERFDLGRQNPKLIMALEQETDRLAPHGLSTKDPSRTTLLHGDFAPQNILRDGRRYGIVDWDQQSYGMPEKDVWIFTRHPKYVQELCAVYNESAAQPLSERLVVAYGLTRSLRDYFRLLQDETMFGQFTESKRDEWIEKVGSRNAGLAGEMYRLTGNRVYAEAMERFSNADEISAPDRPLKVSLSAAARRFAK
jgi:hypothetical protein